MDDPCEIPSTEFFHSLDRLFVGEVSPLIVGITFKTEKGSVIQYLYQHGKSHQQYILNEEITNFFEQSAIYENAFDPTTSELPYIYLTRLPPGMHAIYLQYIKNKLEEFSL